MNVLIFNCWRHSIAFHLMKKGERPPLATGSIQRVSLGQGTIKVRVYGRNVYEAKTEYLNHGTAIKTVVSILAGPYSLVPKPPEINAIAHRVVHGGEMFHGSTRLNSSVLSLLKELTPLAPLHIPHNLAGIEATLELLPHIPQVAVFDTAFHQTIPPEAYLYPLPYDWYECKGIRRYGFHGHAHSYALQRGALLLGKDVADCNLITVVIGRGISVCAIRQGKSIDTSMGLTPLEGVPMGTRCGDIDPGLTLFMMEKLNLSPVEIYQLLNEKSGLKGVAGSADRSELIGRAEEGDQRAQLALDIQGYRLKKQIGSFIAGIGKTDGIVFTAEGNANDWKLREQALEGIEQMGVKLDRERNRSLLPDTEKVLSAADSPIKVMAIPAHPEVLICSEVTSLLE